jgi:PHP family Zn ribbon phosphoesterase
VSYAADLHLHSYFARGTSPDLTFEKLAKWAKTKGIDLLASVDFTLPAWFQETKEKLRGCGEGLYELDGVRFVLGTEVNCTGEEAGRHRRVLKYPTDRTAVD